MTTIIQQVKGELILFLILECYKSEIANAISCKTKWTNTNFIIISFTWSELEPTLYHTQGEHNHYTTDVVLSLWTLRHLQKDASM
jgi:hypothetical protein